jgi:hypothetical protein
MRRNIAMVATVAAAVAGLLACPADGHSSHRVWCDMFHVAYAENTSCATNTRVTRLYARRCLPPSYVTGHLPPCHKVLLGFRCKPTGDAYAVVNCVYGRRRIGLHLAE